MGGVVFASRPRRKLNRSEMEKSCSANRVPAVHVSQLSAGEEGVWQEGKGLGALCKKPLWFYPWFAGKPSAAGCRTSPLERPLCHTAASAVFVGTCDMKRYLCWA